ncbi:glycoside hydrolase family 2 TIM barrel-domain containing protein [Nitrospirillum amazonense]|uniref:glycoside hydrolase family 2 TIM barrel-domain containing protein n=1 Tax=Nitrospirillum amazonense TaxID=28077 RepID=UPI0024128089|nr:glycoside hydrolase family 2 TIM barrel-domain containing protein [Nitrospirillum amazonense]MDG3443530.1 glycoside hydrolase family 2 TIM barrel-domain containing protein [Nitrospirillum amazonense]
MLKPLLKTTAAALALLLGASAAFATDMPFNDGWQFHRVEDGPALGHEALPPADWTWETVRLPHTAHLEARIIQSAGQPQWQGDAFYVKRFRSDPSWKGQRVTLRFEAAMNVADVWLNGRHLTTHLGGFLPFTLDLTDGLKADGENEVVVHLDNRDNAVTGPKPLKDLDFNTYGGLYRGATLSVRAPLHITDEMLAGHVAGGGIVVRQTHVDSARADLTVTTEVRNDGAQARHFTVMQRLTRNGKTAARTASGAVTLAPATALALPQDLSVPHPHLWSLDDPALYELETTVVADGKVVDSRRTRVGLRGIVMTKDGLWLNGRKTFLRGVNRHQEYPYVSYALSPEASRREARLIKAAGFDYVRLSHYPQDPAFMDAADEVGLLVLDGIPGWQYAPQDPAFAAQVVQTCRDMIRRDRNHASVLAWECSLNESPMADALVDALHATVHEELPGPGVYSAGWMPRAYDVYLQARQHRLPEAGKKEASAAAPDKPLIVSEYGDWEYYALNAGFQQGQWGDLLPQERSSRQELGGAEKGLLQQATNVQEAHNDNLGMTAVGDGYWGMFDYNRGYAPDLETSGVYSIDRLPKPAAYFFMSQRDAKADGIGAMVYIATRWTSESSTAVRVFSNADTVELRLNGRLVAHQTPDKDRLSTHLRHPPFTFHLDGFEAGTLEAVAYIGDRAVARQQVRTPGAAHHLELSLDTQGGAPAAGHNDVLFVRARLVDADGTPIPTTGTDIHLGLAGDLTLMSPDHVPTEAGTASFLIRVGDSLNGAVTADSAGLAAVSLPVR